MNNPEEQKQPNTNEIITPLKNEDHFNEVVHIIDDSSKKLSLQTIPLTEYEKLDKIPIEEVKKIGIRNKFLCSKSIPVEKFDADLHSLLDNMRITLYLQQGVGLAAPQIGKNKRIFLALINDKVVEFINPEIIYKEGTQKVVEACLSIPNYAGFLERPLTITVKAYDRNRKEFTLTLTGDDAKCICHEYDHLDGILYVEYVDRLVNVNDYLKYLKTQEQ